MLYNQKSQTIGTSDVIVLGGNMRRKALLASNGQGAANQIFINFGRSALDPASGAGIGFIVHNLLPTLYLTSEQVGPSLREEIHAVASAAGGTLSITEFFEH